MSTVSTSTDRSPNRSLGMKAVVRVNKFLDYNGTWVMRRSTTRWRPQVSSGKGTTLVAASILENWLDICCGKRSRNS